MDLFGPRPERPEFVCQLRQQIHRYDDRHNVRPGISGLAQVNLPADTSIESVRCKLVLDLHYVEHASFWLDAQMFLGTLLRLVGITAESVSRLLRLDYRYLLLGPQKLDDEESISISSLRRAA